MNTHEFINKFKDNNQLAREMANVTSLEEAYEIAKKNKVTDDKETFCQEMCAFRNELAKITPEDLNDLVGGASTTEIVSAVSTYTGAAAAAASAAV